MAQFPEDDTSSLEEARKRLYRPDAPVSDRVPYVTPEERSLPHAWEERILRHIPHQGEKHVRLAGLFFVAAVIFFFAALVIAGYLFYFGGNAVSVDKIAIDIQGPTTISGGDTVPLSITIKNRNATTIKNATIEIDFPSGTRSGSDVLSPYPHYSENLGDLPSGASVTRSIKTVMFGNAGQTLTFPISLSFGVSSSNSVFVKKSTYSVMISSTPLEVTVDTLIETVANKPLTLTLTVRSNATVPIPNVVLVGSFPFGFTTISSSVPLNNSSFLLGTLAPGASKTVTLTGTLSGQDKEQRVFRFTVGTANAPNNQTLAVSYMTQDATVSIVAPFISTSLSINGDTRSDSIISAGSYQNVSVSYTNTLATNIDNAIVTIALSGSAIDYDSIRTSSGFYRSADRTVVFSRDTDPSLATLAPGASGIGAFSFSTKPAGAYTSAPTVKFVISVSGTRVGQTNVPEEVSASMTRTVKVATVATLSATSLHNSGPFANSGPIPPRADQATTYTVSLNVQNKGSAVAGGTLSTLLPSYVTYTGSASGTGTFTYNEASHTVSWATGDLASGGSATGFFQVSLTPSTSQRGSAPQLTGPLTFTGYDRFAGVQISATADPVTTETIMDSGYVSTNANVQ